MITRTVLTALAVAAVAAGSSSTVLITASGNEHGIAQRNARAGAAGQNAESASAQTAEVELPPCPTDVKNHGAYVSSVAKMNRGHAEDGAEETENGAHGALVSAAAQSDCGKKAGDDAGEDAKTPEEKAAAKAERDAAKAARKAEREAAKAEREAARSTTPSPAP